MVVASSRLTGIILFQNIYYTVIESYESVFLHFLFSHEDRESFQSVFSCYILFSSSLFATGFLNALIALLLFWVATLKTYTTTVLRSYV